MTVNNNQLEYADAEFFEKNFNEFIKNLYKRISSAEQFKNKEIIEKNNFTEKIIFKNRIILKQDLYVKKNEILVIEPGTEIIFYPGVSIYSKGKIISKGTADNKIYFKNYDKHKNWGSLIIQSCPEKSVFHHTVFDGGSVASFDLVEYSGMVSVYNSKAEFYKCEFSNNAIGDDSLNVKKSEITVESCRFENSFMDAIDFDFCNGVIKNSYFEKAGNDLIDLMESQILVENNILKKSDDKIISVGENSRINIISNTIENAHIGIAVKDRSQAWITDNKFIDLKTGVSLYQKNKRYIKGGYAELKNNAFIRTMAQIEKDRLSAVKNMNLNNR
jgi:hypothetical protein